MGLLRAIGKGLSLAFGRRRVDEPEGDPLVDWPLPEALSIAPMRPADRLAGAATLPGGVHIFPYPFREQNLAELLRASWSSDLEGLDTSDGRCCDVCMNLG